MSKKIKELEQQISDLEKKAELLKDQKAELHEARTKLVGEMVLKQVADGDWPEGEFIQAMDSFLKTKRDRDLFGLPPLKPKAKKNEPES